MQYVCVSVCVHVCVQCMCVVYGDHVCVTLYNVILHCRNVMCSLCSFVYIYSTQLESLRMPMKTICLLLGPDYMSDIIEV